MMKSIIVSPNIAPTIPPIIALMVALTLMLAASLKTSPFDFSRFCAVLPGLPLHVAEPSTLDFRTHTPSEDGLEKTESISGAAHYYFKKLLGYKAHGLTLSEGSLGMAALANVLERYTKMFPDDAVLEI
jgi:hypothetical protein